MDDKNEKYMKLASTILKTEMTRCNIKTPQLIDKLHANGFDAPAPNTLSNRIGRGQFKTAFFLQCLKVMGVKNLSLEDYWPDDE